MTIMLLLGHVGLIAMKRRLEARALGLDEDLPHFDH